MSITIHILLSSSFSSMVSVKSWNALKSVKFLSREWNQILKIALLLNFCNKKLQSMQSLHSYMVRLNSGNFGIFDFTDLTINLDSLVRRAWKIISIGTKISMIPWETDTKKSFWKFCVDVLVGRQPATLRGNNFIWETARKPTQFWSKLRFKMLTTKN